MTSNLCASNQVHGLGQTSPGGFLSGCKHWALKAELEVNRQPRGTGPLCSLLDWRSGLRPPGSALCGFLLSSRPSYRTSAQLTPAVYSNCTLPPSSPVSQLGLIQRESEELPLSSQEGPGQVQMVLLGSGVYTCFWLLWSDLSIIS